MKSMIPQGEAEEQVVQYGLPWRLAPRVVGAALVLRRRSFARDALRAMERPLAPMEVRGAEHIPRQGPCLVACNHYTRPGFDAWWLVLAVSAVTASHRAAGADPEIHWLMTGAWRFEGSPWRARLLTPATRWAFARVARVYGFVTMPPMPPTPQEMEARAVAVRRTLRLARRAAAEGGMIGLAPEGRDTAERLGEPPDGVGRLMAHLTRLGLPVLPVGVGEVAGCLQISVGPAFVPEVPAHRAARDQAVSGQVMAAISEQVP
jgi:1-acyl-sn-glycerol-3-phosphate acyltransferase